MWAEFKNSLNGEVIALETFFFFLSFICALIYTHHPAAALILTETETLKPAVRRNNHQCLSYLSHTSAEVEKRREEDGG